MAKPSKTELMKLARSSLANSVGYCGHHCSFCSHKACGGCRSVYVGTSYKAACGGACPNSLCASEKGLEGCYGCDDLMGCQKGYYSKTNEYAAKATSLFIRKHGAECYTATLEKAIGTGVKYTKSLDKAGSVENALSLLESYM